MNKYIELKLEDFHKYVGKGVYFGNGAYHNDHENILYGYRFGETMPWLGEGKTCHSHAYILNPDYKPEPEAGKWCKFKGEGGWYLDILDTIDMDVHRSNHENYLSKAAQEWCDECEQCDDETQEFLDNKFVRK
jgi:hypothetical protein